MAVELREHPATRLHDTAVAGVIDALHSWAEEIRRAELSRARGLWEALSSDDRLRLDALTHSIVDRFLDEPTARLHAGAAQGAEHLESARYLFGLDA